MKTRSECDLRKHGVWRYAGHETTEIWCIAAKFGDIKTKLYCPDWVFDKKLTFGNTKTFKELCTDILEYVTNNKGTQFIAHNMAFEYAILNNVLPKHVKVPARLKKIFSNTDNYYCTMAVGSYFNLPSRLIDMSRELNLQKVKFEAGSSLIAILSVPKKKGTNYLFWPEPDPNLVKRFFAYCVRDVNVTYDMYMIFKTVGVPEVFNELIRIHHRMNIHGIPVDIDKLNTLMDKANKITRKLEKRIREINPTLNPRSTKQLTEYLHKKKILVENVQAETLTKLLPEIKNKPEVEEVIKIRLDLSKVSIKKLYTAYNQLASDNTLKDQYKVFSTVTGRFAGKGMQPQNIIKQVNKESKFYPVDKEINSIIAVKSPHILFIADYSSIEARLLGWLANDLLYINSYIKGQDLYKLSIARTLNKDVNQITDSERFIGKQQILSCGYGCGFHKFQAVTNLKLMSLNLKPMDIKRACFLVDSYRKTFRKIPALWKEANDKLIHTVKTGKTTVISPIGNFKGVKIKYNHKKNNVRLELPSGRIIVYRHIDLTKNVEYNSFEVTTDKIKLYGGHLIENIVQAMSFDILAHAIIKVNNSRKLKGRIVMTTHDEIVFMSDSNTESSYKEFMKIMNDKPEWLWSNFKLEAEGCMSQYYRKP